MNPIRQTHNDNTVRLARWRERSRSPIILYSHRCEQCSCELEMTHSAPAELVCPVCNDYRVFRVHESWLDKLARVLMRFNKAMYSL